MKEPFAPQTTISQMLPLSMRHEFFRRVFGKQRLYGYKGISNVAVATTDCALLTTAGTSAVTTYYR